MVLLPQFSEPNHLTLNLFKMNKSKSSGIIVLLVYVLIALSCGGNNQKAENEILPKDAAFIEVSIGGMSCTGCEQTVQTSISKLEGVKSVKASFTTGNAIVEYFPGQVDTIMMKEAVTGSGYTVKKFIAPAPEEAPEE